MPVKTSETHRAKPEAEEMGLVPFSEDVHILPLDLLYPAKLNNVLYRPVHTADPAIRQLARSIQEHGLLEPIVISLDRVIVSGHRRHTAAQVAGLKMVRCRYIRIESTDSDFIEYIREFNRNREKNNAERLREQLVDADPEDSYRQLIEHRKSSSTVDVKFIDLGETRERARISKAKWPFLYAAIKIINGLRSYWPVSLRQIHYGLLNEPPLKHDKKPDSVYCNDDCSYTALSNLLVRARVQGIIPPEVICDENRPVVISTEDATVAPFFRREINGFLKGYARDLMQSQPNHIEVVGEKLTIKSILQPIARDYCIPLTIGRGNSSFPPRYGMFKRFKQSGKETLIILAVSDFDPDGESICESFAKYMRDDFRIPVQAVKVALTHQQVKTMNLPSDLDAKESSSNYAKFVAKYGTKACELEALQPDELQRLLCEAINSVIDIDAFNAEIDAEKSDWQQLDAVRRDVVLTLQDLAVDFPH